MTDMTAKIFFFSFSQSLSSPHFALSSVGIARKKEGEFNYLRWSVVTLCVNKSGYEGAMRLYQWAQIDIHL